MRRKLTSFKFKNYLLGCLLTCLAASSLVIASSALAAGYNLPLPGKANPLNLVKEELKQDELISSLLESKVSVSQAKAEEVFKVWQQEANSQPLIEAYNKELAEINSIQQKLNKFKGLVSFEFAEGIEEITKQVQLSLMQQQENFSLPVFIFSSATTTYQNESKLPALALNEAAILTTKEYGLERVFNQLTIKNGKLLANITQLNTSGRIQLNNEVTSCVERNSTLQTSQIYRLNQYSFYPFANLNSQSKQAVSDTDKAKSYELNLSIWPEQTTKLPTKPAFATCSDEFYQLINQSSLAASSQTNLARLSNLIEKLSQDAQNLTAEANQLFASNYGQGCSTLACIEKAINKPLPYPEIWPKQLVFKATTASNSIQSSLFILLGLELNNFLEEQVKLVASEIAEEVGSGGFSSSTSSQQLNALIASIKLLPFTAKGKEVGLVAKISLVKPSQGLPEKTVKVGPYSLVFRQVHWENSSLWVMEQNLTKPVFNYFLQANKEYAAQILNAGCQAHSDFASCISEYGLQWLTHWLSEQTKTQLAHPSCEAWQSFLQSQDATSCQARPGQLQGLCSGVKESCQATSDRFFSLGWCDTCGKPQISAKAAIYLPSPENGIRLVLNP